MKEKERGIFEHDNGKKSAVSQFLLIAFLLLWERSPSSVWMPFFHKITCPYHFSLHLNDFFIMHALDSWVALVQGDRAGPHTGRKRRHRRRVCKGHQTTPEKGDSEKSAALAERQPGKQGKNTDLTAIQGKNTDLTAIRLYTIRG